MRTVADIGEFGLIMEIEQTLRSLGAPMEGDRLSLGIGDDAALYSPPEGRLLALTTDAQVNERHFDTSLMTFAQIGRRALTVNLSDLAAMGARPEVALVSLGLLPSLPVDSVIELYRGFAELLVPLRLAIAGGNVTSLANDTDEWFIDFTLVGSVEADNALRREAAHPGHAIFVTGFPGSAAAGLELLRAADKTNESVVESFIRPPVHTQLGIDLANSQLVGAAVDTSDGMVGDLAHICRASDLHAVLEFGDLPRRPELGPPSEVHGREAWEWALLPSDDYQLLFTAKEEHATRILELVESHGVTLHRVGTMVAKVSNESPVRINNLPPGSAPPHGWDHFRPRR